jgi:hypothetical protein
MKTDPAKSWTALEIARATGDSKRKVIQQMLGHMVKAGEVNKADRGYRYAA